MSYIIFIFIIIVFHICVDYCKAQAARLEASDLAKNSALIATAPNNIGCGTVYNLAYSDHHDLEAVLSFPISLEKDDEARRPLKFREQARAIRAAQGTAAYVNNVGKAVFPVILVVFTIFYFVLSLI